MLALFLCSTLVSKICFLKTLSIHTSILLLKSIHWFRSSAIPYFVPVHSLKYHREGRWTMVVSSKDSEINQERGDNNMTTNSSSTELSSLRQLGVLGIGLIMEEVGKGARLVFRYPASPPPFFSISRGGQPDMKNNKSNTHTSSTKNKKDIGDGGSTTDGSGSNDSIDLFFDLPARVISKLFRPKRPLCGQPLTLVRYFIYMCI